MTYTVDFYDGKTAIKHRATLSILLNSWSIHYVDEMRLKQVLYWELENITYGFNTLNGSSSFKYSSYPYPYVISSDSFFVEKALENIPKNYGGLLDKRLFTFSKASILLFLILLFYFLFFT